jgi:hypothetical protein
MHQHAQSIGEMQPFIEAGSTALIQHLSAPEWQHVNLDDKRSGLESDVLKMMVVLEAIFEHARAKFAAHLPSRLDCVFVWPTLILAKKFRQQYIPVGVIHRCRVRGETVERDGSLLPPGIDLSDLSPETFSAEFRATQVRAENYWTAREPPELPELLVKGIVEVVRQEIEHG